MDNIDEEDIVDLSVGTDSIEFDTPKEVNEDHKDGHGKQKRKPTLLV